MPCAAAACNGACCRLPECAESHGLVRPTQCELVPDTAVSALASVYSVPPIHCPTYYRVAPTLQAPLLEAWQCSNFTGRA